MKRLSLLCFLLALNALDAHAQATRTWVSGVGDDANPGSRTAPCKTFAGAISKTAAGGEISVLDPGGFGAVTITKSITLDGAGTLASVLASGTNGIVINAAPTDVVILRNLSIKNPGQGVASPSGLFGVKIIQAGSVHIENCMIASGTDAGISFTPTNSGAKLFVENCIIDDCSTGGIVVGPVSPATATANITNTKIQRCNFAIFTKPGGKATLTDSSLTGSKSNGAVAVGVSELNLLNTTISDNNGNGIVSGTGAAPGAIVRISGSRIVSNSATGLLAASGSQIISLGNNTVAGNATDGNPTSVIGAK